MSSSVPEGWGVTPLGDMCRVKGGKRLPKGSAFSETITPFPYIRVADFQSGSIKTRGIKYVSTNVREQIKRYTISSSDIYISIAGSIGLVGVVPQIFNGALLTENAAKIVLNDVYLDRTYLCLFLSSEIAQSQFKQEIGTGGGVPKLALFRIEQTVLSVPPLPEQKKIASILTSVDEVIENTQKQIDKLQDLKKATMNELLTKGIGHTEFKDTELGRIPKSWDVRTIGELGNIITGSTPSTTNRELYDGDYMFVSPADISEGMFVSKTGKKLSLAGLKKTRQIPNKSIMVVCIGSTIGKVALTTQECASNQQINSIVPKENDPYFIYFAMKWMAHIIKKEAGTQAVPLLNKTDFSNLICPVPPTDEQQKIGLALHSINVGIESLMSKLSQTQSLKKSLMQDLLTGKVRVTVN